MLTVDKVLKNFRKTITDLKTVNVVQTKEVKREEATIALAETRRVEAKQEADRALALADKLEKLLEV